MDKGKWPARLSPVVPSKEAMDMKFPVVNAVRSCRGQSMVEFALVAPMFLLLVFGILDFGRLFFTQETLQYALREAGRLAVTGQHSGTNRVAAIIQAAQRAAPGLDISNIQITSGGVTNYAGGPRETVVISLSTGLRLITPMIG